MATAKIFNKGVQLLESGKVRVVFQPRELLDLEVVPRGLYLTEIYAGDFGIKEEDDLPGYLIFNVNRKADPEQLCAELVSELEQEPYDQYKYETGGYQ